MPPVDSKPAPFRCHVIADLHGGERYPLTSRLFLQMPVSYKKFNYMVLGRFSVGLSLAIRVAPFADAHSKRSSVSTLITSYAQGHQVADVGLNILTFFVPGGGLVAMAGAMAIQAPLVYQPMERAIAKVYLVNNYDTEVRAALNDATIEGAEWDVTGAFSVAFFQEILVEVFQEIGVGAILCLIPILGTLIAAAYDAKIAATLTWRVGLTVALYYENGCEWLGDRRTTYEKARFLITGGLSAKTANRANINDAWQRVDGLGERQASLLARYLTLAKQITGLDAIQKVLLERLRVDPALVELVLTEVRSRRVAEGRPSATARARYTRCCKCGEQFLREDAACPHCS
jgi:hypothetical protein